jgi:twitching motility protein PilU
MSHDLRNYLKHVVSHNASDLFLSVGAPATMKVDGVARLMSQTPLDEDQVSELIYSVISETEKDTFHQTLELNKALDVPDIGRFRINLYMQRGYPALVARHIPSYIPTIEELNLPLFLKNLVMENNGLVLIVGAAGTGKSTTLASMVRHRNDNRSGHILCIEDPIEYIHQHNKSIVDQREVGLDTHSFGDALRNAMREAPDVIVIGEIRDYESLKNALSYAETGHLCLSTLHANNANQALERILSFFGESSQKQVLLDLSLHLKTIISQRLVMGKDDKRLPAVEIMMNTPFITDLIHNNRIDEIREAMTNNETGCRTFDQSLLELYLGKMISKEEALANADSRTNVEVDIRLHGKPDGSSLDGVGLTYGEVENQGNGLERFK